MTAVLFNSSDTLAVRSWTNKWTEGEVENEGDARSVGETVFEEVKYFCISYT